MGKGKGVLKLTNSFRGDRERGLSVYSWDIWRSKSFRSSYVSLSLLIALLARSCSELRRAKKLNLKGDTCETTGVTRRDQRTYSLFGLLANCGVVWDVLISVCEVITFVRCGEFCSWVIQYIFSRLAKRSKSESALSSAYIQRDLLSKRHKKEGFTYLAPQIQNCSIYVDLIFFGWVLVCPFLNCFVDKMSWALRCLDRNWSDSCWMCW